MLAEARRTRGRDAFPAFVLGAVLVASVAILATLAIVLWTSFLDGPLGEVIGRFTLKNYASVLNDSQTYDVIRDTLAFAAMATAVPLVLGIPIAWLYERTDLPGKSLLFFAMTIGIIVPGFAVAMGWLFLLDPRIGILNTFLQENFGFADAPFNIVSLVGMGWVQGLSLTPVAFIMTAAVFRAMDPALEEAAQMAGARPGRIFAAITAPLAWPGILAASIYIFTIGFAAFDVPAIIGWSNRLFTFATFLFLLVNPQSVLPRYGVAAALSTVVLVLAVLLSWWYARMQRRARQYAVVTGKAYRPRAVSLGRVKTLLSWGFIAIYLAVSLLVPIALLVWSSILPFFQLPSLQAFRTVSLDHYYRLPWQLMATGFWNTGALMLLTPTVTVILSLCFSWLVLRSRVPGRPIFDFIAFLPHAVPSIIFGVGAFLFAIYVIQAVLPIYGTIWILLFVFVIARVSFGTRMTNSGLIQIHPDIEEAAQVAGARGFGIARQILVPMLRPTLVYVWLWTALLTFRELTLAVIVSTPKNLTLPVVIWSQWSGGDIGMASSIVVVLLLVMSVLIALYWLVAGRRGLLSA